MVQIIEGVKKPSFGEQILSGIEASIPGLQQYAQQQQAESQFGQENQAINRLIGQDISGIRDPKIRQEFIDMALQGQNQKQKLNQDFENDQKNYDVVSQTFGKKFADVWKASPVGGQTELLKYGIDAISRGENLDNLLKDVDTSSINPENVNQPSQNIKIPQLKNGQLPENFNWPDFSKRPFGYNNKEWAEERKSWRKENAPIFEGNKTKLAANAKDELGIKKLSNKLPEGFERIIINPETGEPYALAQLTGQVSPEVQEWIKETARFQNRAKDAFGSRVTNFDLMSYMKQFPGLLNTTEGRNRILNMMEINNKLDQLYEKSLRGVYQKYGLSGIPQEEAERLATSLIEDETEKLRNEYVGLDEENQKSFGMDSEKKLSGRLIDVIGPDGQEYEIDESEVEQLPEGFRVI